MLGGWQLNGILQSRPDCHSPYVADLHHKRYGQPPGPGGKRPLSSGQSIRHWFDQTAFTTPALYTYGNAGPRHPVRAKAARFYFRPRKLFAITKEMLADRRVMRRRLREGQEFLQFLTARRREAPPAVECRTGRT